VTVPYCTTRDVFDLGLSARAFVTVPRPLDARAGDFLDFATGTFWQQGHGLDASDLVWLVLIARGGTNALPGGASETTPLYPLPLDFRRFQLSLSEGGSPVVFTDAGTTQANGSSAWGILTDPLRRLEALILAESADCDQCLIAHRTPIERDPTTHLYPQKLVDVVARGAARRAIAGAMFDNAATKIPQERLDATAEQDRETKARWLAGQPIYPAPVDQSSAADNAGQAASRTVGRAASQCPIAWVTGRL
jgi:hypothetical protein